MTINEHKGKKAHAIDMADFRTPNIILEQIKLEMNLMKNLSKVDFSHIISLNIEDCQIDSIELLSCINMKSVKSIRLTRNNITSVKALRKGHWVNLQFLNLSKINNILIRGE